MVIASRQAARKLGSCSYCEEPKEGSDKGAQEFHKETHRGMSAQDIAQDFCEEHDLPREVVASLAHHLRENLQTASRKASCLIAYTFHLELAALRDCIVLADATC